ncbi:efflux transporter outer membrane subunit [Asaia bogorensis]|uniref:RND transporter NodT n=1 Tax=Asaia bogorensis NBRC 16594 TaxID=1231624 RepID=A0AAN4R1J0_9PROT|nr:efflux transporter outer membrane subunit [Asaia bogorensis]BAT20108.1 type I secretion outer membrane protein [Asaia bogorensis NBRC 16594]GBQ80405.1 RND efflux system outer membrane lipoprotein [Asaia bogorensis NBRC 16594]GEL52472.1 RND transporter NodT [Asaia bogorensis NBRC 16594]
MKTGFVSRRYYPAKILIGLCLLSLGATGCQERDFNLPKGSAVVAPAQWRQGDQAAMPTKLDPQWWGQFGDPVLVALVAHALDNNPDLALAAENVMQARAQMRLALSAQLPHIDGQALGIGNSRLFGSNFSQYILGGGLTFDFDLFGKLREQTRAARIQTLASAANREAVRLALIGDTVRAYVSLQASRTALEVLQRTLIVRQNELVRVRHQLATGYEKTSTFDQANALVSDAQSQIELTRLQISQQENALAVLLGEMPSDEMARLTQGKPLAALVLPPAVTPVPARLLANRPDLIAAADQIIAADHSLRSARAAFLPDISINPGIGTAGGTTPISGTIWSLGGSMLAPIFEGGALRARESMAVSQRNQAAWSYRKVAVQAFREVQDALTGVTRLAAQEESLQRSLEARRHTLEDARKELATGYVNYFDVANAETAALSAELQTVQVRASRLAEIATLYQAAGGGWTPPKDVLPLPTHDDRS